MTNEYRDYKYRVYETVELLSLEASLDYHDPDLAAEICDRAGMLDTYEASDEDTFEGVLDRALEVLKED